MFAPLMEGIRSIRAALVVACAAGALGATGCGGGERQDEREPEGAFKVEVVEAKFPAEQSIAERATLSVKVRNADAKTVPNVAVTVKTRSRRPGGAPSAFGQAVDDTRLADSERPIWIVDRGPKGGDSAYTNTWALGALRPGQTRTFEWRLTAVKSGAYTIDYEVSPGLNGKARLASGTEGGGSLKVMIDDKPSDARVGENGEVIRSKAGADDEDESDR